MTQAKDKKDEEKKEEEKKEEEMKDEPAPELSDAAKKAAAATDATRSFFQANLMVGVFSLIALILSLTGGILGSAGAGQKVTQAFVSSGMLAIVIAMALLFFKRIMPALVDWAVSITNEAYGKVFGLILNVIFLLVLINLFMGYFGLLCGTLSVYNANQLVAQGGSIPMVVATPLLTIIGKPLEILQQFLNMLQLSWVAVIAIGGFTIAVIVKSMFLDKKKK